MLKVDVVHLRAEQPLADGTYLAVTMLSRGEHGVMVWAGHLDPSAAGASAEDISLHDYVKREAVSFMAMTDALDYFEGRPVFDLVQRVIRSAAREDH